MNVISIDDWKAGAAEISAADHVAFIDPNGRVKIGKVKIKKVKQKGWSKSKVVFLSYAYAQYREGKKVKQKYLGIYHEPVDQIFYKNKY